MASGAGGLLLIGAESLWSGGGVPSSCPTPPPASYGYVISGRLGSAFSVPATFFSQLYQLTASGAGAAVLVSKVDDIGCGPGPKLALARVAPDGEPGSPVVLVAKGQVVGDALAGDPEGDAAAAWLTDDETTGVTVEHAAIEVAGGGFVTRTIASASDPGGFDSGVVSVAVALGPDHSLLVVYEQSGVWAATISADGAVSARQKLGPAPGEDVQVAVGESATGGAVAAWTAAPGGSDQVGPTRVYASTRAAADAPFAPAAMLDAGVPSDEAGNDGELRLAVGGDGQAALEWENAGAGDTQVLRAALGSTRIGFATPVVLAHGFESGTPALGPAGQSLFAWTSQDGQVFAATAAVGSSRPGPAQVVSEAGDAVSGQPGNESPVALFTSAGQPVVVWEQELDDADDDAIRVSSSM